MSNLSENLNWAWTRCQDANRGSGRTTLMLKRAELVYASDINILIGAANEQHASFIKAKIKKEHIQLPVAIVRSADAEMFTMGFSGKLFNDHYALEVAFADVCSENRVLVAENKKLSDKLTMIAGASLLTHETNNE